LTPICPCDGGCPSCKEPIQPKLIIGKPNDKYEREADKVADAIMNKYNFGMHQYSEDFEISILSKEFSCSPQEASPDIESSIDKITSGGNTLPESIITFFEPRFRQDFSHVRVHTDNQAAELAKNLNAQAFTIGNHITFGSGRYNPETIKGKKLLAHELTHTVQQTKRSSTNNVKSFVISRMTKLGTISYTVGGFGKQRIDYWVGTEPEWKKILKKSNSEEDYRKYIQGFLELSIVGKKRVGIRALGPGSRLPDYKNTISRDIKLKEKLAFMRALYGLAEELNIGPRLILPGWPLSGRYNLAKFIEQNQSEYIIEVSKKGRSVGKGKSFVVGQKEIEAVASQGGYKVRVSMVVNAMNTAVDALYSLIQACAMKNEKKKSNALAIISNAGQFIRFTLNAHKAALKKEEAINMIALDLILDITQAEHLPGVKTLLRRLPSVKSLLTSTAKKMVVAAGSSDDPNFQAYKILETFINNVMKIGPNGMGLLNADYESHAINNFRSSLSVK
jgi:hypothetical protein